MYLGHFEIFLNVILSRNHNAVTSLRYLTSFVQDEQLQMNHALLADCLLGSQIITMVRLQFTGFLRTICLSSGRIILPDFTSMTDNLSFRTWTPPALPPILTTLLAPRHMQPPPAPTSSYTPHHQQQQPRPYMPQTPAPSLGPS